MLNADFRKNLVRLLKNNSGKIPLTMYLSDPVTKYKIEFLSNKFRVAVSNELTSELSKMGITFHALRK